jgi:hypothetical protein
MAVGSCREASVGNPLYVGYDCLRTRKDHVYKRKKLLGCNAVVLKLWGATPREGGEGLDRGAQHTFLQIKIKTARN